MDSVWRGGPRSRLTTAIKGEVDAYCNVMVFLFWWAVSSIRALYRQTIKVIHHCVKLRLPRNQRFVLQWLITRSIWFCWKSQLDSSGDFSSFSFKFLYACLTIVALFKTVDYYFFNLRVSLIAVKRFQRTTMERVDRNLFFIVKCFYFKEHL